MEELATICSSRRIDVRRIERKPVNLAGRFEDTRHNDADVGELLCQANERGQKLMDQVGLFIRLAFLYAIDDNKEPWYPRSKLLEDAPHLAESHRLLEFPGVA